MADLQKPLTEVYEDWIANAIDEEGISLPNALCLHEPDALTVYALAVPITDAYRLMLKVWQDQRPREMIFGFDRFTKPDQGTTLADLVAGFHFTRDEPRPFIIEYQHAPRLVRPIAWHNEFWNAGLRSELVQVMRQELDLWT